MIHVYNETYEKADELFQLVYSKAVSLTNKFGIAEKLSKLCEQQINWSDIPSETVMVSLLDVAFAEMQSRSVKKKVRIMNYCVHPRVEYLQNKIKELIHCLKEKCDHVMPPPGLLPW